MCLIFILSIKKLKKYKVNVCFLISNLNYLFSELMLHVQIKLYFRMSSANVIYMYIIK